MNRNPRPFAVTVLGWLFVGVGCAALAYHLHETPPKAAFEPDLIWMGLTEFLAILSGIFLLRGRNWARWLAVAWMAFHLIITGLNQFHGFAVHALLFAGIAWLLFRPDSAAYFQRARAQH